MSIPVILASHSPARRKVLFDAGICPTIRESHVDEPAALEAAARERGISVDDLSVEQRVMILAEAQARAVYEAYKAVANASEHASGERVTGYPLRAEAVQGTVDIVSPDGTDRTRDFSGVDIPTQTEPIEQAELAQPGLTSHKIGPLIIGCDSMFLLDGVCYGKPHTVEVARERLRKMSGATGELWTGHCIIDFATGKAASGASRAAVHFSEFSEQDMDAYIATGEPLEVAGSFTLDGFGGAFIRGVDGDPSGIIGLSLPLARQLVNELGAHWIDLWNVPQMRAEAAEDADETTTPKTNVHQPGDGWINCACGRRHWGKNGAAGVLLARRDEHGNVTDVVMQHRALWSAEGGTWGIPGGAIADGENPIEGALRESFEEANITPQDIEVVGSYREDHGPWAYTTVFAFEKPGHHVEPKANDDESMEIEWVPLEDVPNRKLLTAMKTDWPRFAARLQALAAEHRDRD